MSENNENKIYQSVPIPVRQQVEEEETGHPLPHAETVASVSNDETLYYEIEYDACPIPGVGKFVLKSQKIAKPEKDKYRDIFGQMRDIARINRSSYDHSRFFDRRVHQDNAAIFYKQGMFMKDFTDNYAEKAPFSQYFPYYQMMGYEQLRTYFTWRTEVRQGNVSDISLSYAFLYIYELLGNIGVEDPQDGLNKLMSFWQKYSVFNKAIDKYVLRWLKDYHIYYQLPQSFRDFIATNNLSKDYPKMAVSNNNFDLFCAISKYDIRKSAFFHDENEKLITDCFYFVTDKLKQVFADIGICFDESIFRPTKKMLVWTPFKDALFCQWKNQRDRQIVLSENEIYICSQNQWTFNTVITAESGKQLVGYIMKQMEADLRKAVQYQYKLSADISKVTHTVLGTLDEAGLSLENVINNAVIEFYREATKTVVKVDRGALSLIREEALATQEKLSVPEQAEQQPVPMPFHSLLSKVQEVTVLPPDEEPAAMFGIWGSLKNALTQTEKQALSVILREENGIKKFADACGMMAEVLIDGINEKAMDCIGDNLMDEEFVLYDDYKEQVKELIG